MPKRTKLTVSFQKAESRWSLSGEGTNEGNLFELLVR